MLEFLRIKRKMSLTQNLNVNTLENPLWEAACNIRGDIGAPKYKDYILPLIFLKMEPQGVSAGCCPKPLVQKQLTQESLEVLHLTGVCHYFLKE